MSSTGYSTVLRPDPRLRMLVLLGTAFAVSAGLLVIATLPAAGFTRLGAGMCWLAVVGWKIARLVRGWRRCEVLGIASDGTVTIQGREGPDVAGRLCAGSLVLARVAWLRFETPDGYRWAEPAAGNPRECDAWRRLRVIWRHLGSAE